MGASNSISRRIGPGGLGSRWPCSQDRRVATGMPQRSASCGWERPKLAR